MHLKVNYSSIVCGGMVCECVYQLEGGWEEGGGGLVALKSKYEIESKAKIMRIVWTKLMTQLSLELFEELCELLFAVDDSYHIFCLH